MQQNNCLLYIHRCRFTCFDTASI